MMAQGPNGEPIYILQEGAKNRSGRNAQENNIMAERAVAESVRSTLGPLGFDKLLVGGGGEVTITNDGVTILELLHAEHPAAKIIIEISKTQDSQCHDGTTTTAVISGALLEQAKELIEKQVHPAILVKGYHFALSIVLETLDDMGWELSGDELADAARTSINGKSAESAIDTLSDISVRALDAVRDDEGNINLDNIKVSTFEGGTYDQSELLSGLVVEKERVHSEMPQSIVDAKVLLLKTSLEPKETKIESKLNINDPAILEAFLAREEEAIKAMCQEISNSGANAVFCQKDIDPLAAHYLAQYNILATKRVKNSDMEALRRITGAKLVSEIKELKPEQLGSASLISEEKFGEHICVCVTNEGAKSVTAILRGATGHTVSELERCFDDVIGVVALSDESKIMVAGGGSAYAHLARVLRGRAHEAPGRQAMAVESFASALESIPWTLAENSGADPVDTLLSLKSASIHDGVSIDGEIKNMKKLKVIEPRKLIRTAISSAVEASTLILRIDDVISMKPSGGDLPPPMMGMGD